MFILKHRKTILQVFDFVRTKCIWQFWKSSFFLKKSFIYFLCIFEFCLKLWTAMWILRIEPRSFRRAARALSCWDISPVRKPFSSTFLKEDLLFLSVHECTCVSLYVPLHVCRSPRRPEEDIRNLGTGVTVVRCHVGTENPTRVLWKSSHLPIPLECIFNLLSLHLCVCACLCVCVWDRITM